MSLFAALASAEVWLGAAGLAVGGLLELALEFRLRRVVAGHAVLYFTWEYIGAPLLRAALITGDSQRVWSGWQHFPSALFRRTKPTGSEPLG